MESIYAILNILAMVVNVILFVKLKIMAKVMTYALKQFDETLKELK